MSDPESLHIRIGISGTYWAKRPRYRIEYNDTVVCEREIAGASGEVEYTDFDCTYTDSLNLRVCLINKDQNDTVENSDKTAIVQDMLLNIESCSVDEIELDTLLWSKSEFRAEDETRPTLHQCVNLGWNGAWCLSWTNPFYLWLLESI